MTSSNVTKDDLFRAILALDVYHRGYNAGLSGLSESPGTRIGNATIGKSSLDEVAIGLAGTNQTHESIGFYALEYDWNGQTVVAYRGTDSGFGVGAGVLDDHRTPVSSRGSKARPGT